LKEALHLPVQQILPIPKGMDPNHQVQFVRLSELFQQANPAFKHHSVWENTLGMQ
jgi:hypothetical protein